MPGTLVDPINEAYANENITLKQDGVLEVRVMAKHVHAFDARE